ncbi:MAG TPA: hypothetical protein PL155_07445 [Candidatus Omnitrophota bacterium]|nr:hypothetical protein [Candidatus Omnitrophota bacterium]HPD85332.1 hypothetical protein [Candidatus Omnitrophota bacterium]HRZ04167.1 hypothetical protein [Candidatus Omnitrophota bacterium]
MNAEEITLNIAVNLGRLGRWAAEGKRNRIQQFLDETETYIVQLEDAPKSTQFLKTFESFKKEFSVLKTNASPDMVWADMMLTWANILTHRAKLA